MPLRVVLTSCFALRLETAETDDEDRRRIVRNPGYIIRDIKHELGDLRTLSCRFPSSIAPPVFASQLMGHERSAESSTLSATMFALCQAS
jgi:hypothetical protein